MLVPSARRWANLQTSVCRYGLGHRAPCPGPTVSAVVSEWLRGGPFDHDRAATARPTSGLASDRRGGRLAWCETRSVVGVSRSFPYHRRSSGNRIGRHRHRSASESLRCMPRREASPDRYRCSGRRPPKPRLAAHRRMPRRPAAQGRRRPNPVDDAGSATTSRNRVTVARTHPGHQRWTVPGGSFRGVATDVRCHRHRSTAPTAPGRGSGLAPPCLAARRSAGCGGLGRPRRGENECAGETVRTICCPARSATVRARAVDLAQRLVRTYVILILPKCLLTWGYVKVDPAAFLSTARGTGTAHPPGPVEI